MDSGSLVPANSHNLRDVRSDFAAELNRPLPPIMQALPVQDSVLRDYFRVLAKRLWVVVGCIAVIVGVVTIATLRSTRIYEASGQIVINKADPVVFNLKDSPGGGMAYDDPTDLDTEVLILKSDLLALQVIRELNLDKQAEPGASGSSQGLQKTSDALQPDSAATSGVLGGFKNQLSVALVPGTRAIEIRYRSPNPDRAAQVVNTLMRTYVEQNFKTRFESTMQASDWLSKQLVDLQIKVETSQEKLVRYQKEHNILGIDEKQNIITSKLDELNKGLTAAESDRMEKESVYRLVQAGDSEITTSTSANTDGGHANGNATSSLLDKLREQEADLRIQIAQLSTQFGPSYPKVVQLNTQLKEVDTQKQIELGKVQGRVRGDYVAAAQHEGMLRDAMEKQKQEANKLNESAIEYSLLRRDLETNRTLYEGLLERLKEAGVTAGLRSNNFRIVGPARRPVNPSEPNIPRNLTFALALGLTTGIGLAFVMEALDNTVRTPEQAQGISALPSLGMIPLSSLFTAEPGEKPRLAVTSKEAVELVTQARPQSQMAESYRALRTSLLLTSLGAPPKVILVTSALPQEGKTTTSLNTAIVLAQKGSQVLLIDADLRRPSIHKALGMGPRTGLSNVLTGSVPLHQAIVRSTLVPTLHILPAGTPPPNPAELLASTNMRGVLKDLRDEYDHIVIDTPPTLSVTDAVVLSTAADSVVLVIRSGQTTKQALRRARDLLVRVNARIAGVLLNAADLKSADYYYYYEYRGKYGDRYYKADEPEEPKPSVPSETPAPIANTGSD